MTWFGISVTYIRFYQGFKYQGFDRSKLPYASKLQPYAAYYAGIASWLICFVSSVTFTSDYTLKVLDAHHTQFSGWKVFLKGGWDTATFVTNYIPFIMFPILYIIWKVKTRVPVVKVAEMDFITNIAEIEADTYVFQTT